MKKHFSKELQMANKYLKIAPLYMTTVLRNLLIILALSSDSHLHTPMYFFLANLSA
jgi:hypothetical protein